MDFDDSNNHIESAIVAGLMVSDPKFPYGAPELDDAQHRDRAGIPYVVVPHGATVASLKAFLPKGVAARCSFNDVASFLQYVQTFTALKSPPRIWAGRRGPFVAYLDYHVPPEGPDVDPVEGRCQHRADLVLEHSEAWREWIVKRHGKWLTQYDFAEFIEDRIGDIVGDGAEMLEIARTLESKQNVAFKSGVRLDNGDFCLNWETTSTAKAGQRGDLEVPDHIGVLIPVFDGEDPIELVARLRYRITDGALMFQLAFKEIDARLIECFDDVRTRIAVACQVPVYIGKVSVLEG